jgi:uncharacterized membrane protein YkvA (DUF1232 family)
MAKIVAHAHSLRERAKRHIARVRGELRFYQRLLQHPRTPRISKSLLGFSVGYLLMPFDIIPDFIPILGQLDDLLIIPVLVYAAVKFVPDDVIAECRTQASSPEPDGSQVKL